MNASFQGIWDDILTQRPKHKKPKVQIQKVSITNLKQQTKEPSKIEQITKSLPSSPKHGLNRSCSRPHYHLPKIETPRDTNQAQEQKRTRNRLGGNNQLFLTGESEPGWHQESQGSLAILVQASQVNRSYQSIDLSQQSQEMLSTSEGGATTQAESQQLKTIDYRLREQRHRFAQIKKEHNALKQTNLSLSQSIVKQKQEEENVNLESIQPVNIKEYTLDRMYDQSGIGPGSYEHHSQFASQRDWVLKGQKHTNLRYQRPVYSFGTDKKANESRYLSNEHMEVEHMLKASPSASTYAPNIDYVKTQLGLGTKRIGGYSARFDEYSFKKLTTKAPSPADYDVKDQREITYEDSFHHVNHSFNQGERFLRDYYTKMHLNLS